MRTTSTRAEPPSIRTAVTASPRIRQRSNRTAFVPEDWPSRARAIGVVEPLEPTTVIVQSLSVSAAPSRSWKRVSSPAGTTSRSTTRSIPSRVKSVPLRVIKASRGGVVAVGRGTTIGRRPGAARRVRSRSRSRKFPSKNGPSSATTIEPFNESKARRISSKCWRSRRVSTRWTITESGCGAGRGLFVARSANPRASSRSAGNAGGSGWSTTGSAGSVQAVAVVP